jgi:hypothetical protein
MTLQPFSSVYKYTDPIRYFKANDPYFYEVDNIPLKQLQENCNFLKDQINGLAGGIFQTSSEPAEQTGRIKRSDFDELLPYVNGTDNKVYVRPGRYIARINDAYSITPLQIIRQIASETTGNRYMTATVADNQLLSVLNNFKTKLTANATFMNGLFERTFVRSMRDKDYPNNFMLSSLFGYDAQGQPASINVPYPFVSGEIPSFNMNSPSVEGNTVYNVTGSFYQFLGHPGLESAFIKRWRGITRTSVVNIPEVLSVEIPEFSVEDYFYFDDFGQRQQLSATQRIDLVFIYSKPIDASSTTIAKFNGQTPVTINQPMLGIVKGAGIGLNFKRAIGINSAGQQIAIPDSPRNITRLEDIDGIQSIVANASDEESVDIGLGSIKGSFPSPDDIMNLAPLISENLEAGHTALIGQSILPVAYVVRRQIVPGIIDPPDLIDIRPFFRTAELAYNERAGLAAATPQVSIANPVATEAYVDQSVQEVNERINTLAGGTPTGILTNTNNPRIIRSGYIRGGLRYGVESVLADFLKKTGNYTNINDVHAALRSRYDYPAGMNLANQPDWDLAEWVTRPGYTNAGTKETDYMNFSVMHERYDTYFNQGARRNYADHGWGYTSLTPTPALSTTRRFGSFPQIVGNNDTYPNPGGYYSICFVKKSLIVRKAPWVADVRVDARLFNCCPMSFSSKFGFKNNDRRQMTSAKFSNIWTSKRVLSPTDVEVTIFVSWAMDLHGAENDGEGLILPSFNRDSGDLFAGFLVMDNLMSKRINTANGFQGPWNPVVAGTYPNNIPAGFPTSVESGFSCEVGVALYPTVQFDIIAVPNGYGAALNYGDPNNTLIQIQ